MGEVDETCDAASMHGALRLVSFAFPTFLTLVLPMPATAHASELHPLSEALPAAAIEFRVRADDFQSPAEVLECTYRPRRERDVRKERHLHLFGSPWQAGSRDLISTQRETSHATHATVAVTAGVVRCSVPLRDPEPGYEDYQLHSVRIGRLTFARWTASAPQLPAEFGLHVEPTALRGTVRPDGCAATPLGGSFPLWPQLRVVEVVVAAVDVPTLQLWDNSTKHHWDGWRFDPPVHWEHGYSVVHARPDEPTVWISHSPDPYPRNRGADDTAARLAPRVWREAALEIFWPQGATLDLTDVKFDREVSVVALPLHSLPAAARATLARANLLQPGAELGSLPAQDWESIATLGVSVDDSARDGAALAIAPAADGREILRVTRGRLAESWAFFFVAPYDAERRVRVAALVLHPQAWSGTRPE